MLVVAHDAGGAEVVSSWLRRNPQCSCRIIVEGPAVSIFERKLGVIQLEPVADLERLVEESSQVLTGTSWGSDLEKQAIRLATRHNVKVVSFLDHWGNYPERFQLVGEQVLPDEIWVGDKYALEIAEETFKDTPVQLVDNPYLLDIQDEISSCKAKASAETDVRHLLYICEPVAAHAYKSSGREDTFDFTEFEAMSLFLTHLRKLDFEIGKIEVRIRLHPSEPFSKYDSYIGTESVQFPMVKSCDTSTLR